MSYLDFFDNPQDLPNDKFAEDNKSLELNKQIFMEESNITVCTISNATSRFELIRSKHVQSQMRSFSMIKHYKLIYQELCLPQL